MAGQRQSGGVGSNESGVMVVSGALPVVFGVGLALWAGAGLVDAASAAEQGPPGTSGLPVPRFVSLKSDKVNVRSGPAKEQDVAWVYSRAALPVEVTAEFENWR